jgi:hypothetical protein
VLSRFAATKPIDERTGAGKDDVFILKIYTQVFRAPRSTSESPPAPRDGTGLGLDALVAALLPAPTVYHADYFEADTA